MNHEIEAKNCAIGIATRLRRDMRDLMALKLDWVDYEKDVV